ncbi:MAG: transcriptional regulator [Sphingobacteriales bacterium]|nr:MAG: transcriptional regulator [Sphingobacteriales bacterium]
MKWQEVGEQPCSIARALSVVGDRWTMLIMRNAFLGIRRFDDFQVNLGVTRHLLSDRLKRLVEEDILTKVPYQDRQQRFEYRLTEKGRELYPVILSLVKWGDKWMDQGLGAPLNYIHQSCGKSFVPLLVCSECHEEVTTRNVTPIMGNGFIASMQAKQDAS